MNQYDWNGFNQKQTWVIFVLWRLATVKIHLHWWTLWPGDDKPKPTPGSNFTSNVELFSWEVGINFVLKFGGHVQSFVSSLYEGFSFLLPGNNMFPKMYTMEEMYVQQVKWEQPFSQLKSIASSWYHQLEYFRDVVHHLVKHKSVNDTNGRWSKVSPPCDT